MEAGEAGGKATVKSVFPRGRVLIDLNHDRLRMFLNVFFKGEQAKSAALHLQREDGTIDKDALEWPSDVTIDLVHTSPSLFNNSAFVVLSSTEWPQVACGTLLPKAVFIFSEPAPVVEEEKGLSDKAPSRKSRKKR